MKWYSVQPKDQTFVKYYGFLSFSKNTGKDICNNISKNFSGKYSRKSLDHAKQSDTDARNPIQMGIPKRSPSCFPPITSANV